MSKVSSNIAVGKSGMSKSKHPSTLSEAEYTFALNTNCENESGDGIPMLQNEHSNLLCSKFKVGFKVIGFKNDLNSDLTYYFLTNPVSGESEIGFINNVQNVHNLDDVETICDCNIMLQLSEPLENIEQDPYCTYTTIVSNSCLNFSIDYPVYNIIIKDEKSVKKLYFTDNNNPQRHLDITNIDTSTFNCDDLRIFKLFTKPCIFPHSIEYGGELKAGVYEFLVAYCDKSGNEITQYYSITNTISIFDENRTILEQSDLDYKTNLAVGLTVSGLDNKFDYYKVAVIQRTDVNLVTSYFIEGVHPIGDNYVTYYTDNDKQRTTLNHLMAVKPTYTKAGIMTSSNGYLFQADLTSEKEYNLQPVALLMGSFLKWKTVKANEDLYKNGINTSLYKGYMRDETYPFSIRFFTTDGYETARFVLANRPHISSDMRIVNNKDVTSINEFVPDCSTSNRNKEWQFYNTATISGNACGSSGSSTDLSCDPVPYKVGNFGYSESTEKYPINSQLYDASTLRINKYNIPVSIKTKFESYYTLGSSGSYYNLNNNTNFVDKNIRHFKFPDFNISPFMSTTDIGDFSESIVYPIGITIDEDVINFFLDVAVDSNLITSEQRDKIDKFEILRGDRTLHKSIIAKGLTYDMYKYDEEGKDVYYPNYPYNDLGDDDLNYLDSGRSTLLKHPYNGDSNNRFTFHSPDIHFYKPTIPTEVKFEAYQVGKSRGKFVEVEGHSKWVILTDEAFSKATSLAVAEMIAEFAVNYGDFMVQNAVAGDRVLDYREWGKVRHEINITNENTGGFGIQGTYVNSYGSLDFEETGSKDDNIDNYGDRAMIDNGSNLDPIGLSLSDTAPSIDRSNDTNGDKGIDVVDVNVDKVSTASKLFTIIGMLNSTFSKFGQYRYEWLKIFKDNGQPENFGFYYTSEGYYNYAKPLNKRGDILRGLKQKKYINAGRAIINESGSSVKINNVDRESSLYMSFGDNYNITYDNSYKTIDNSRFDSENYNDEEIEKDISSYYASLKNYVPNQYGDIESIKWVTTGHCGDLKNGNTCNTIFGGDIFISRFSLKRKIPLFLANATDLADLTPFNYYNYRNIGYTKYYADYDVAEMNTVGSTGNSVFDILLNLATAGLWGTPLPQVKSQFTFANYNESGMYVKPSKFYLFYYGIPQFLVESEINCNYRYGKKEPENNFYPNLGDYVEWTQEKNVSIKEKNRFFYNSAYSKNTTIVGGRMLPSTYDKKLYDSLYDSPNGVIYSMQDNTEQDITDPWLIYRPLDYYQFPTSAGKLIDLKDIESSQLLGRFENQIILFNAIDTLRDRVTPNNQELGTGGIFNNRPLEFKKTDLGYAGTQHRAMVSCEYGHYWVDSKRGQVFSVDQNGKNLKEITLGMRHWFKEHLPFKILRDNIEGLTIEELDNNFKGLGITMGWDSRYKRVFITKKDYILKDGIKGVVYEDKNFKLNGNIIALTDTNFFEDVSYTIAYSVILNNWISFYSFTPNYYISYHNYFKTGVNYSYDNSEEGLWSHLLTNKSFQVFYGKLYPWMIELPNKETYTNKVLGTIEYWLDSKRYHNEYDFAEKRNEGFNKAWVHNNSNNSGQLNLIVEDKNNMYQKTLYPKINNDDTSSILVTENDKKWTFNSFYNRVNNELNNMPIWYQDANQIMKSINTNALDFRQKWLDRVRGDWNLVTLSQDKESRFKYVFKWLISKDRLY